ncbi:Glycosyltransferase, GT2 family [Catalinimonas alkaloidigena]|uniref:Glycosyltransferase, GT2 family n=1 Tax=Catalinimonas alkaloidigena TaxID=1075417 RepID=A0A1G9N1T4_9BACT|nr:glycosyltransferase [Catalinimonas alkaloidigena]SDL80470.1 Glycosyltransferase, GT2 family [Catalinimonas alkaloidigena]
MLYSFIIPVYNRPDELLELLESITQQTHQNFEVVIIEDGSEQSSEAVVRSFQDRLDIAWYPTTGRIGQGFSRNLGFTKAKGDYFIILDSDTTIDPDYLENLDRHLNEHELDAFGGPDRSPRVATPVQQAIDYCMTSPFTTGGIRGRKNQVDKFYPRSFNMGFSREVYEATQGFNLPYLGEDIELSTRIMEKGFSTGLVPDSPVYHKRKTSFLNFYKQIHFFGRARVNLYKLFPHTLKLPHLFPAVYLCYFGTAAVGTVILTRKGHRKGALLLAPWALYQLLIFTHATMTKKSLKVGLLSTIGVNVQMIGYGAGFIQDFVKRVVLKKK